MLATAIMVLVALACAGVIACTVSDCWRAYRRPTRKVPPNYLMAILSEVIEDAERQEREEVRTGKRVA